MIRESELKDLLAGQRRRLMEEPEGLRRALLDDLPADWGQQALIVSGIRRCGKSTLLKQLAKARFADVFFVNFDVPLLFGFSLPDCALLDRLIAESGAKTLFFDELQVVTGWELYVRQKLDEGFRVVVTGSNASLLSRELGTKLTGRHLTKELYPFSFAEFCRFRSQPPGAEALLDYLGQGGFPEYLKWGNPDLLTTLFDDILYRDIAVRYGIRDVKSLKGLLIHLVTHVARPITATKLGQQLGIKSAASVLDYLSYFEQAWLVQFMPRFSYSHRAQLVNPRKVYVIDNGLVGAMSAGFTKDWGWKLENTVYWSLKRRGRELFYFLENGKECDFVVRHGGEVEAVVQVCAELTPDNRKREEEGLLAAMDFFGLPHGLILTLSQSDTIHHADKQIQVLPVFDWESGF